MKRRKFIGGLLSVGGLMTVGVATPPLASQNKIESPKIYSEPFYEFFKHFNGFEISQYQKFFYEAYLGNKHFMLTNGRQAYGCSTLLLTMAAWESLANQHQFFSNHDLVFISSNSSLNKLRMQTLKRKELELGMSFPVVFVNISSSPFPPISRGVRIAFYDCSGDWHSDWNIIQPLVREKTFALRTINI